MFSKEFKSKYGENLYNFVASWRRDLKAPDLKFYIGELCTKTVWGMESREPMYAIRVGRKAVTDSAPRAEYVPTSHVGVEIGSGEGSHYHDGTLGQLEHGVNYADVYLRTIGRTASAPCATTLIPRLARDASGWQVHIPTKLLESEPADTERALVLLKKMLDEIVRDVPVPAVAGLRYVPVHFSPAYKPGQSGAEYHLGVGWLRDNGRDPGMVRAVEFSGVHDFEAEMKRMPNFALHELAHAYQHRVLKGRFDHAGIKAAYERAKASGSYDRVERWFGNGRPNTRE